MYELPSQNKAWMGNGILFGRNDSQPALTISMYSIQISHNIHILHKPGFHQNYYNPNLSKIKKKQY